MTSKTARVLWLMVSLLKRVVSMEWPTEEERINIIGQNGNEGEHYKDIEVIDPQQVKVKRVKKILQKSPSRYRVLYTDNSTGWISKKDYKENPERINYF